MKILAGIISTIENEYEESMASIRSQNYPSLDIIEIKNLRKKEAHDKIYRTFMDKSSEYELFMKMDADMVISDAGLIHKVSLEFEENRTLDHLIIPVFDHFTKNHLWGVNVYRSGVKWRKNKNNYYTDRVIIKNTVRSKKKWVLPVDQPVIHHCPDPGEFQAFHFGYHRMMKALQPGVIHARFSMTHWKIMIRVLEQYRETGSMNNFFALLGAECALVHGKNDESISYDDQAVENHFTKYRKMAQNRNLLIEDLCPNLIKSFNRHYRIGYLQNYLKQRFKSIISLF